MWLVMMMCPPDVSKSAAPTAAAQRPAISRPIRYVNPTHSEAMIVATRRGTQSDMPTTRKAPASR